MSSEVPFQPFAASQFPGGIVVNVFAVISAIGLSSVAIRVGFLAISALLKPRETARERAREFTFFNSHIGYYAACLLLSDLCSAVSGLIGLSWLLGRGITPGLACTTQAVLLQFANATSAYFVCVLGIHTFLTLVLRHKANKAFAWSIIALGVAFGLGLSLYPIFLNRQFGPLYGPSGLSCGVRNVYPSFQFSLHLLPIFIASSLSALISSLVFLIIRGTLVLNGSLKINLDPKVRWSERVVDEEYHRFVTAISKSMLWYPVAYVCLLVPYAVARLLSISGRTVPFEVTVFAFVCWFFLGIVNVLLLYNTFRVLVPAIEAQTSRKDLESFGTPEAFSRFSQMPLTKENTGHTPSMFEKIERYRNPTHEKSPSLATMSSASTTRPLLLSTTPSPYVPRAISPSSVLNRGITSPLPVATRNSTSSNGSRRMSLETSSMYSFALSAAPRPARSNIARESVAESISSQTERYMISVRPAPSNVVQATDVPDVLAVPRGRGVSIASVNSSTMEDMDISGWLARQSPNGSMPVPAAASISAVATQETFPTKPYFEAYPPRRESSTPASSSLRQVPSQPLVGPIPFGRRRPAPT